MGLGSGPLEGVQDQGMDSETDPEIKWYGSPRDYGGVFIVVRGFPVLCPGPD